MDRQKTRWASLLAKDALVTTSHCDAFKSHSRHQTERKAQPYARDMTKAQVSDLGLRQSRGLVTGAVYRVLSPRCQGRLVSPRCGHEFSPWVVT